MITVKISEDDVYELLINRLKTWTDDEDIIELFEQYYDSMVYGGCYDGCTLDVMAIVDNDYVNNTFIRTREKFEKAREEYIEEELNRQLEDLDEDDERTEEDLREEIEEDTPTWEELERGENILEFLDGEYIEAKTDNSILLS